MNRHCAEKAPGGVGGRLHIAWHLGPLLLDACRPLVMEREGEHVTSSGPRYAVNLFKDAQPYELDRGVTFHDMVGAEQGSRTLVSGFATFEPGAALPLHTHNVEEVVTVLDGEAECEVDGQVRRLWPYDTTFVRPDVPHRFRNVSSTSSLRIMWVYGQMNDGGTRVLVERRILR